MNGHYWCDDCDEPAFTGRCRKNHHVHFVAHTPQPALTVRAFAPGTHLAAAPLTPARARELFDTLFQQLQKTPP